MRKIIPVLTALVMACSAGAQSGPEPDLQVTAAGEVVLLQGQSAVITIPGAEAVLMITFTKVASDSRCPSNVQCVWAGEVSVLLALGGAGSGNLTLNLPASATAPTSADAGPYRIELRAVTPYPAHLTPREAPDRVTLAVSLHP